MVCRSVTVVSPAKMAQPIEVLFSVEDSVGLRNHVLDGGPDLPMEGQFLGRGGTAHCKVQRHSVVSCEKKRLNQSRCSLGFGLGCAKGIMY